MIHRLNQLQLRQLSSLVSDIGIVSLASVVLPSIFVKTNYILIIVGTLASGILWSISIWFLKGGVKKT